MQYLVVVKVETGNRAISSPGMVLFQQEHFEAFSLLVAKVSKIIPKLGREHLMVHVVQQVGHLVTQHPMGHQDIADAFTAATLLLYPLSQVFH